ncbi:MAG: tetratricopeptide repeat protein, partial [Acidobacteriaceae bacterium]|nr:tetratricopeptide repeat protein [Acidobacteriaceae bacterium]
MRAEYAEYFRLHRMPDEEIADLRRGLVSEQEKANALEEEKERLTNELIKLQQEKAASTESIDVQISMLLAEGKLDDADDLLSRQVKAQQTNYAKAFFDLGRIKKLRFKWDDALDAYRKAWKLEKNTKYGSSLAYLARKRNRFNEAITTYEALIPLYANQADRAGALNNLAILYSDTNRMEKAESAYDEALKIRRELAESSPDVYRPDVASTLNNLA